MTLPVVTGWHREFVAHLHSDGPGPPEIAHSHCPRCGNRVGGASTACVLCEATFPPSPNVVENRGYPQPCGYPQAIVDNNRAE